MWATLRSDLATGAAIAAVSYANVSHRAVKFELHFLRAIFPSYFGQFEGPPSILVQETIQKRKKYESRQKNKATPLLVVWFLQQQQQQQQREDIQIICSSSRQMKQHVRCSHTMLYASCMRYYVRCLKSRSVWHTCMFTCGRQNMEGREPERQKTTAA